MAKTDASKKKPESIVKLQIPAGKANPAPPVGTALGPKGINIMEFCKAFNSATSSMGDFLIPVVIEIYKDRSFSFITKCPPMSALIKHELGMKSGSKEPGRIVVNKITQEQAVKIAKSKMPDLNTRNLDQAVSMVFGTAYSIGIEKAKS